jgi:hypothetical protein
MKKLIGSLLVLGLGIMLLTGCQSSSTSTPSGGSVPATSLASDLGQMAKNSLAMDSGVIGVAQLLSASGIKAQAPATPVMGTDGYWYSSDSFSGSSGMSYDYQYKFRIWNAAGTEMVDTAGLATINSNSDVSKVWVYITCTYTYTGGSYTISFGNSVSDPLKFDYSTSTVTGPIAMSSTYSGTNYGITMTYNNLSTNVSGYPTGSVSWTVSEGGTTTCAGTIVFDGDATAVVTFTSGYSGTYTVNIDTGVVSSIK